MPNISLNSLGSVIAFLILAGLIVLYYVLQDDKKQALAQIEPILRSIGLQQEDLINNSPVVIKTLQSHPNSAMKVYKLLADEDLIAA